MEDKEIYKFGQMSGDGVEREVEVANTYRHQLLSIHLFASQLGYEYNMFADTDGSYFEDVTATYLEDGTKVYGVNSHMDRVKFSTMQKWHDQCFMGSTIRIGVGMDLSQRAKDLGFDLEKMRNAIESKLYKRTYFQVTKEKRLKVNKHIIDFA